MHFAATERPHQSPPPPATPVSTMSLQDQQNRKCNCVRPARVKGSGSAHLHRATAEIVKWAYAGGLMAEVVRGL